MSIELKLIVREKMKRKNKKTKKKIKKRAQKKALKTERIHQANFIRSVKNMLRKQKKNQGLI